MHSRDSDGPDIDYWINEAERLYQHQDYSEALTAYEQALALDPKRINTWYNKGVVLAALNRYDEALAAYDRALALDPNDAAIWYNKGNALATLNRYDEALTAYDRALTLDPNDAAIWYNKGVALAALKRNEEALTAYEQALAIDPNDAATWELMGHALGELQRYDEAVAAEDKALQLTPASAPVWSAKGWWLYVLDRPIEALAAYDEAVRLLRQSDLTVRQPASPASSAPIDRPTAHSTSPQFPSAAQVRAETPTETLAGTLVETPAETLAKAVWGRANVVAVLSIRGVLPETVSIEAEDTLQDAKLWYSVGQMLAWQQRDEEALVACGEALTRSPYDFGARALEWTILRRQRRYLMALKVLWRAARDARKIDLPKKR